MGTDNGSSGPYFAVNLDALCHLPSSESMTKFIFHHIDHTATLLYE